MDHRSTERYAHWLQHVPFEGPGSIASWFEARGYRSGCTRLYQGEALPPAGQPDLLVVMGGPMSVNDLEAYPWIARERDFIREVIARGTPVLGVCLGAQLIAAAMGATVRRNPDKEIGWFPVTPEPVADPDGFRFHETMTVLHWHGDTFSLPDGAIRLARSAACENQAFQLGRNVIGLQFHLEATPGTVRTLVENCGDELTEAPWIQQSTDILGASEACYREINACMDRILDYLAGGGR